MRTLTLNVICCTTIVALLVAVAPAQADWWPDQPAKWVQMPDTTRNGMDVSFNDYAAANMSVSLGDDFLCTQTGKITDIHIWCSWFEDLGPAPVTFNLSIWSDQPAIVGGPHSQPLEPLWNITATTNQPSDQVRTSVIQWNTQPTYEGWYEPITNEYIPNADENIWQYNFFIDPEFAFLQEGTDREPIIYWLVVDVLDIMGPGQIGWKTRTLDEPQFNDDAVWGYKDPGTNTFIWTDMHYPQGHIEQSLWGQSFDLAFVITPEPGTMLLITLGGLAILRRRR